MMQRVEIVGIKNATHCPPLWKRVVKQPLVVRMRFNLAESTPRKVAKIVGIAGFGGIWTHPTHIERRNSDRVNIVTGRDSVLLRVYPYIRGSGATTDGTSHTQSLITLPRDPSDPDWTHAVEIEIAPGMVIADMQGAKWFVKYDTPGRCRHQWLLWGHARNGGEYLMEDEKIVYEIEVL